MKRILIIAAIMASAHFSIGQTLRAGLAGGYNSTWLFNKQVSDAGDELDYKSSFGPQFGVEGLFNLDEGLGISAGILFGSVNQKYTNRSNNETFETATKLKYIDIPLLFRRTGENGPYFEIGPQFSIFSSGTAETPLGDSDIDSDQINGLNISGVLGFGYDAQISDNLVFTAGLRFAYGFTDAGKEPDNSTGYEPTHTAVGGLHIGLAYIISE